MSTPVQALVGGDPAGRRIDEAPRTETLEPPRGMLRVVGIVYQVVLEAAIRSVRVGDTGPFHREEHTVPSLGSLALPFVEGRKDDTPVHALAPLAAGV